MTRHLLTCLAIAVSSFISPAPAAAADNAFVGAVYDTVDAIQVQGFGITVTGIISGQSAPSTLLYRTEPGETGARCDRLALLAMSKPGKFQFATVVVSGDPTFGCKLIVRTP